MEVQVNVKEYSKSSDQREKSMENQVIMIKEECNEGSRRDGDTVKAVVLFSLQLCVFGALFPRPSAPTVLEHEHSSEWFTMVFMLVSRIMLVLTVQIVILRFTLKFPENRGIFTLMILFILVITAAISVFEVSTASTSNIPAIIVSVLWGIVIAVIAIVNRRKICNVCICSTT